MIFTSIKRILLIAFICFSALVHAQQVDNPYQGNVMVGSFDEAQLKQQALQQVLVKVSGNTDIVNLADSKLLVKKTQALILQYGYRNIAQNKYFFAVFDKNKINHALKEMQQPIWGGTRPITLIWLIHNNKIVSDNLIKEQMDPSIRDAIQKAELQRGIRMQFPLMDLDDSLAISISDIKGNFYGPVGTVSARYQRAHFVLAELQSMGGEQWKLSWQLIKRSATSRQTHVLLSEQFLGDQSSVSTKMINALADYYASQYAILDNQGQKFSQVVHINGIDSLAELVKLHAMFNSLLAVSSYHISAVQGAQMTIEVKLNGSLTSFKNTLIAQPDLQLDTRQPPVVEKSALSDSSLTADALSDTALYFIWR
ncbi:MAG: DUF2066 domain-containing protein [Psychromonas sp.]